MIMINAVVYAMKILQNEMQGQASSAGLDTEKSIENLVAEVRRGLEEYDKEM